MGRGCGGVREWRAGGGPEMGAGEAGRERGGTGRGRVRRVEGRPPGPAALPPAAPAPAETVGRWAKTGAEAETMEPSRDGFVRPFVAIGPADWGAADCGLLLQDECLTTLHDCQPFVDPGRMLDNLA